MQTRKTRKPVVAAKESQCDTDGDDFYQDLQKRLSLNEDGESEPPRSSSARRREPRIETPASPRRARASSVDPTRDRERLPRSTEGMPRDKSLPEKSSTTGTPAVARPERQNASVPGTDAETTTDNRCLEEITGPINGNVLGCHRVAKALIQFAREAGLNLLEAEKLIGDKDFPEWLTRSLGMKQHLAESLIQFSQQPDVLTADVSPVVDVPLTRALQLVGILCDRFPSEPTGPMNTTAELIAVSSAQTPDDKQRPSRARPAGRSVRSRKSGGTAAKVRLR